MPSYIAEDGSLITDGRRCLFLASEVRCCSTFVAESIAYELHEYFGLEMWDLARETFGDIDDDTDSGEWLSRWRGLFLDPASGFVASKFMCRSLSFLHRVAARTPAVSEAFFGPNAYWIVLRRRDRLEQAVSLAAARKSGAFHHYGDPDQAGDRDVELTLEEMDAALKSVALSDIYLQTFAESLPPERVTQLFYRDFVADEVASLNRIHAMCGFPPPPVERYRNGSKLARTGQDAKRRAREQLRDWFLANHA
jgi:hypothetical protein